MRFLAVASALLLLCAAASTPLDAAAQATQAPLTLNDLPEWARTPTPPPRRALVVGISEYDAAHRLTAPSHDADRIAALLGGNGFNVQRVPSTAPSTAYLALSRTIETFAQSVQPGDIVIIYFSGHGMMMNDGDNYLIPSDAKAPDPDPLNNDYIPLSWVMQLFEGRELGSLFIILDACRYNPFINAPTGTDANTIYEPAWPYTGSAITGGLGDAGAVGPRSIGLSAGRNQIAYSYRSDEPKGRPSIYTRTLAERLERRETLNEALTATINYVGRLTSNRVRPEVLGSGAADYAVVRSAENTAAQQARWLDTHALIRGNGEELQQLENYLDNSAASDFAIPARQRVAELRRQRAATRAQDGTIAELNAAFEVSEEYLTGALRYASFRTEATAGFAVTSGNVQLVEQREYGIPIIGDPIARDRVIANLPAGQEVEIIELNTDRNWAQVMLPDGQVGTIRNVRLTQRTLRESTELIYDGGGESAGFADPTALAAVTQLQGRDIRLVVGGGSGAITQAQANEVAYVRGQRLALAIQGMGADPTRVSVELSRDPELRDHALVEVFQ